MVSGCLVLSATRVAPADFVAAFIAEDRRAGQKIPRLKATAQNKSGPAAMRQSPTLRCILFVGRSVAEEQPQQNDHRNRHAQQPQQDSSSHHLPPQI
jgi:hypothetical protein